MWRSEDNFQLSASSLDEFQRPGLLGKCLYPLSSQLVWDLDFNHSLKHSAQHTIGGHSINVCSIPADKSTEHKAILNINTGFKALTPGWGEDPCNSQVHLEEIKDHRD